MPQIICIDSQQLSSWQTCKQMFYFSHVEHLEVLNKRRGIAKGSTLHSFAEVYYKELLVNKNDSRRAGFKAIDSLHNFCVKNELSQEDEFLCMKKAGSYLAYHANDLYYPVAVEVGFSLPLYVDQDLWILYEGRIDLIARWKHNDQYIWVDHKNYLIRSKPAFQTNQFFGYTWALSETFRDKAARQGLLDCTWMGESVKPTESHEVFVGNFLSGQIDNWKTQAVESCKEIAAAIKDPEKYHFPQNHSACHMNKFGPCKFLDVCHAGSKAASLHKIKNHFKVRDEKWSAW